jgi:hypothetical protein
MSPKTIKLLAFIILLVHGIGHLQGVVSSMGIRFHGSSSNVSWLLKGLGGRSNRLICLILYLLATIFGILTALSFNDIIISTSLWTNLALITAFVSLAGLILFPRALAMFFNKAGSVAVNGIIFYSILFNGHWPAAVFEN